MSHNLISEDIYNNLCAAINKAYKNPSANANILREIFFNLIEYNKDKLSKLTDTVTQDIMQVNHSIEDPGEIFTALVDNKYISKDSSTPLIHYYPIEISANISIDGAIPITSYYSAKQKSKFIGIFFKCSYEDFIKITDSNVDFRNGYNIEIKFKSVDKMQINSCRFLRNSVYIENERLLEKIAEQYGFEKPLIFSPYARRFAEIIFTEPVNIESIEKIKFSKEIDTFIEATTLEKTLVWNIELKNSCSAFSDTINEEIIKKLSNKATDNQYTSNEYIIPDANNELNTHKSIYKCNSNEYFLFDGVGKNKIGIGRKKEDKLLYILCDSISKPEPLLKLTIDKRDSSDMEKLDAGQVFQNYYSSAIWLKQRLYSYADICYTVSGFNGNPFGININMDDIKIYRTKDKKYQKLTQNGTEILICDYNTCDRYYEYTHTSENPHRTIRSGHNACCVLSFIKTADFKSNINFIEDYARYVLSYLNEKYPEFDWKGKKGWLE